MDNRGGQLHAGYAAPACVGQIGGTAHVYPINDCPQQDSDCAVLLLEASASGFAFAEVTVTPVEALERGMHATVKGTVVRISDEDTFKLKDDTGDLSDHIG